MAGFSFLANMLPTALTVASSINKVQQQKAEQKRIGDNLRAQQQQNAIQAEADTTARRDALRRAAARQRAQFGAQGIDSSDGSAAAILLGLEQQSNEEQAQADQRNALRNRALEESASQQKRKNLLGLNEAYDALRLTSLFND